MGVAKPNGSDVSTPPEITSGTLFLPAAVFDMPTTIGRDTHTLRDRVTGAADGQPSGPATGFGVCSASLTIPAWLQLIALSVTPAPDGC